MDSIDLAERNMVEIVTHEDLARLDLSRSKGYIGFEPSGIPHLGTAIIWKEKINDLVAAGVHVSVLLADWHARINDKLGGDMRLIRLSGEMLKGSLLALGLSSKVDFIWASDVVKDQFYWETLLKVAKNTNLSRLRRSLPIMGRTEDDADTDFSKYIYPLMQVTDIVYMDLDIAVGGMDQRHAHMLARDIQEKMGIKKVVSLHGPLLGSLLGSGRMDSFKKMSKSDPNSAVFLSDSPEDIRRKLKNAFCPMGEIEGNPVASIVKEIYFPFSGKPLFINRPASKGGPYEIGSWDEFSSMYLKNGIHPMDLKSAVSEYLVDLLEPARKFYLENEEKFSEILAIYRK